MTGTLLQPGDATSSCLPESAPSSRWLQVVSHLDPKYGGLSSAVPAIGQRLARIGGFEVSLAGFCAPNERFSPPGYDSDHLSFWPLSRRLWLQDRFTGQGTREAFQHRLQSVDALHIHGLWEQSTAIAASSARVLNLPYILSAHGMLEPWALANKRLKKLLYSHFVERSNVAQAACLHALTQAEAEQFLSFGARSPIAIIPNGIDIPGEKDAQPFFDEFPSLEGKRIILFLARLHPKKGLDLLLQAWVALAPHFSDAHLILAGPDTEGTRERLERFVATHDLGRSVTFTGMLQGTLKESALAAAEAFVLPSFSEGHSVSVLEAMAMGLPVIVTEACNMPEVATSHAGWQIQANIPELTAALRELLTNSPAQNRSIGANGACLVGTRYAWTIIATQMAEVYRWVAGGPKPTSVDMVYPT